MDRSRMTIMIGWAIAQSVSVGSASAQPIDPLPRPGISRKPCRVKCPVTHRWLGTAPILTFESGWMRHAFTPPRFKSESTVASREVMSKQTERAIAAGPRFLIGIDLSRSVYAGVELAAGGLAGPAVFREGVDISDTGFYIGLRAIAGARFELGRVSFAAELAPGVNDVSYESPSMRDKRGNPVRYDEVNFEVDVRTRVDVQVTRALAIGLIAGTGSLDRHDVSTAVALRLRSRPR